MVIGNDRLGTGVKFPCTEDTVRNNNYIKYDKLFRGNIHTILQERMRNIHPMLNSWSLRGKWIYANYFKLLTKKTRDFLLYETPIIDIVDVPAEVVDCVLSNFWSVIGTSVYDYSKYGDTYIMVDCADCNIHTTKPDIVYKIVDPINIDKVVCYTIAWVFKDNDKQYIRYQQHYKGYYNEYVNEYHKNTVGAPVSLLGIPIKGRRVATGLDGFQILGVHNLRCSNSLYGVSDYTDLIDPVAELCVRYTLNSKALTKNAEPTPVVPKTAITVDPVTKQASVKVGNAIVISGNDPTPSYMTYDPKLDASFKQIEKMERLIFTMSEMPLALVVGDGMGAVTGEALRRLATNMIMRIGRVADDYTPVIKQLLHELLLLKGYNVPVGSISITWQDGIPLSELERSQIASSRIDDGTMTEEEAIEKLDGTTKIVATDKVD